MARINTDEEEPVCSPENPGLIRCTNAGAVLKRPSQASLQMLSQNISPLGKPIATLCLSLSPYSHHLAQGAKKQGRSRSEGAMRLHNPVQARL